MNEPLVEIIERSVGGRDVVIQRMPTQVVLNRNHHVTLVVVKREIAEALVKRVADGGHKEKHRPNRGHPSGESWCWTLLRRSVFPRRHEWDRLFLALAGAWARGEP